MPGFMGSTHREVYSRSALNITDSATYPVFPLCPGKEIQLL